MMNSEFMCKGHKAFKEFKCKEISTLSACANAVGCEWDEDACEDLGIKTVQYAIKADAGSSFHAIYEAAETCAMKTKSQCAENNDCSWEAKKGICDMEQSYVDAVCGNENSLKILEVTKIILNLNKQKNK